jgi:hypothetical protein
MTRWARGGGGGGEERADVLGDRKRSISPRASSNADEKPENSSLMVCDEERDHVLFLEPVEE